MNLSLGSHRRMFAVVAMVASFGAMTGCHKKEKPVNPASLGPMPTAPAAICMRAMAGILCVLMCGRSAMPDLRQ